MNKNKEKKFAKILLESSPEKEKSEKEKELKELGELIKNHPHAFVLACIMNTQISAEKAWKIPSKIEKELGGFELDKILESKEKIKKLFRKEKLHRFNAKMAERFIKGAERINEIYKGRANNIWRGNKSSGDIVSAFLEFEGVGLKIATMATNILVRTLNVSVSDRMAIDISPDRHIRRIFKRVGLVKTETNKINKMNEIIMYKARALNPKYPGKIDKRLWDIGKKFCKPHKPDCKNCPLKSVCEYSSSSGI
jgi:endonuclease III